MRKTSALLNTFHK